MKRQHFIYFLSLLLLGFACRTTAQKFPQLAETPPMGWNSWNKFACDVNENLIKGVADAILLSGLQEAGYSYIVIDDCWHGYRDDKGFIHEDSIRFPSGMKALADYIHSKGLKFGIYSDAGTKTCGGRPGSKDFERQDAQTYAAWGVDYLKYDWCNTEGLDAKKAYTTMRDELFATGRPILFSMCEWGNNKPWEWAAEVGHMWRTTGDIYNCFDCFIDHGTWKSWGVMQIVDMQQGLRKYAGKGHWNDPDMLEVGNGMPIHEDRAHFSLWCMLNAPLILGNDVRNMSDFTKQVLTNKAAIAINQDALGVQGFKAFTKDSVEYWFKPLLSNKWAVCLLNRSVQTKQLQIDWLSLSVKDPDFGYSIDFAKKGYQLQNIWTAQSIGTTKTLLKTTLNSHDVLWLTLTEE